MAPKKKKKPTSPPPPQQKKATNPPIKSPNTIARTFGLTVPKKLKAKVYHETLANIIRAMEKRDEEKEEENPYAHILTHLNSALQKLDGYQNANTLSVAKENLLKAGVDVPVFDAKLLGRGVKKPGSRVVKKKTKRKGKGEGEGYNKNDDGDDYDDDGHVSQTDESPESPPGRGTGKPTTTATTTTGRRDRSEIPTRKSSRDGSDNTPLSQRSVNGNKSSSLEDGEIREDIPQRDLKTSPKTKGTSTKSKSQSKPKVPEKKIKIKKKTPKSLERGAPSSSSSSGDRIRESRDEAVGGGKADNDLRGGGMVHPSVRRSRRLARVTPEFDGRGIDDLRS